MPDAQFRRNLDRAERKFDLMQALGRAADAGVLEHLAAGARRCRARGRAAARTRRARGAARNLRIGFEALAWGRHVQALPPGLAHRRSAPTIRTWASILDSFHTLSLKDDPAGIAQIPGEKIFFLQMADAPLLAMDVLQWARHYRNFPGQGQFDLDDFFEQVLRAGYTGPLSLEIFNDVFRETPNRRTAVDAMRSLLYLEAQVRDAPGSAGRGRERRGEQRRAR